ncbi:efflux RND transporter periplasmic adaptor subunit [Massilia sp. DWR3-1-1]|uniref:efflux RND transporter periplasmic adaptor subunit n=1 Tax=Massilia sp. DWR3-1-1 TaxID=2804559 RepID=UPI003CF9B72A
MQQPPVDKTVLPNSPRSGRSKLIGTIVAIAAMIGLGWLAWHLTHPAADPGAAGAGGARAGQGGGGGGPGGGRRGGAPATTVGVATAETMDIPVVIDALGTVTAAATATVRPQVSGVLQKIHFSEGQLVKAGQVLATIDPRAFEMALLQSSGQRQRDEAQLDSARLTLSRYRTLLDQDSIARQDVDTQAALVKQLEGTVMTDKAAEGVARLNLSYTQVKAPIAGRVGLRVVDMGNLVGSADAAGIAVITQLAPIDVEFAIAQDQVPAVQERIVESTALPALAFDRTRTKQLASGRFNALDNQVDTQTGTVKAKARFVNTDMKLFPSQFVNLRLEVRNIKGAVVVPVTSLRHGASGDFVYVLNADKTVSVRAVTRGQATVDKVQVASGLKAGEQVITEGADRLKDGARVTLPGDRPAAGAGGARRGNRAAAAAEGASAPAATPASPATPATPATPAAPADGQRRQRPAASTAP